MTKKKDEKVMLAEQVFEVRHVAVGSFLDVRGFVADYIKENGFLPHWKIDANTVNFRDQPDKVKKEGAFAGYRTAGYFIFDPETRNLFSDRAGAFWRLLMKNRHYNLPDLERFGARTKVFIPSDKPFEEINHSFYQIFYTDKAREVIGGTEKDVQFIIELKEQGFDVRVAGGPIHKGEVKKYLNFESERFDSTGFFLDLDFYRTADLTHENVPHILHTAVDLTWTKVEKLASAIGI